MKYKILGSVVLSSLLAASFLGCGSDNTDNTVVNPNAETDAVAKVLQDAAQVQIDASLVGVIDSDKIPFGDGSFSPFERVAVMPTVKGADGTIDHNATYAKVVSLARVFASYVSETNEPLEDNATFKGANWITAGIETMTPSDENIRENIIQIPTKKPMNPNFAYSKKNTKKVQVIEVCNSTYAAKALGVINVGGEDGAKVPNGIYHTTALPCEVTIYNDEKAIYVDMLNPETIFTLFFTEVFDDALMRDNAAFKADMFALPTQVKKEIFAMIYNAFDEEGEQYSKTSIKMGTVYSSMKKATDITDIAAPYTHYAYQGTDTDHEFTSAEAKEITAKIMNVMTLHSPTAGTQESALHSILPSMTQTQYPAVNPLWRSGRQEPLKVPGGSWIIEACSPPYAKEALSTGEFHTPALPCEIAVFVQPDDNKTLNVTILNPDFMFNGLFADGMKDMNATTKAGFQNIINNINADLLTIVDYALDNNVSEIDQSTRTKITPIVY